MSTQESEFTAKNIEIVLQQFYGDPTNAALNNFLTRAQGSRDAWNFSFQLLENRNFEAQFFGASTLHFKISKHWHEVPGDQFSNIQHSLLKLLSTHGNIERAVVSKICICLSCFVLQTMPKCWHSAIDELAAMAISHEDNDLEIQSLKQRNVLEILTALPEEYPNIFLFQNNRSQVASVLIKNSLRIIAVLKHILEQQSAEELVKLQSIMCFTSWINFGMSATNPGSQPVVFMIFDHLRSPTYFSESVQALTRLFKLQGNSASQSHEIAYNYLQKVVELSPLLDTESENVEVFQSLTKIIVTAAENNVNRIAQAFNSTNLSYPRKPLAMNLFEIIYKTVNINGQYPTKEISSNLSFRFWFNLQDELMNQIYSADARNSIAEEFQKMLKFMTYKAQYPSDDEYDTWPEDTKKDFGSYRQDFAEAAAYFSESEKCRALTTLVHLLKEELTNLENGVKIAWQKFESIIYLMTSIMEVGKFRDSDIVEMDAQLKLVPCDHIILTRQKVLLMGSYAREMNMPMILDSIDFFLECLQQKEILSAALISLNKLLLCQESKIAQVSVKVLQGLEETMKKEDLQISDGVELANCLGYVLSVMPQEKALQFNETLMHSVRTIIHVDASEISSESMNHAIRILRILDGFFMTASINDENDFIDSSHFILKFLEQLFPCVKQIISLYVFDENIMKELFEMLKKAVSSLSCYVGFAVSGFGEVVSFASNFKVMPCIFDFTKYLFLAISDDNELMRILQPTFNIVRDKSFQIMEHDYGNHLDIVECSMNFFNQMVRRYPALMNSDLDALFKFFWLAIVGIDAKDMNVSKSSCQFLALLILNVDVTQVIEVHGRTLLERIVLAIAVNLPMLNLNPLADVIMALHSKHFDFAKSTLTEILSTDQFPLPQSSTFCKEDFVDKMFHKDRSKLKIKELTQEYAEKWRIVEF